MIADGIAQTSCANCGATLAGRFCSACGQKATALNPSLGEFLHELVHELVHVDGKIVQSVRYLVTAPGRLTREHFDGRRAAYISPIRLYLLFSVLYFAVTALAPGTNSFRITVGAAPKGAVEFSAQQEKRESNPEDLARLGFKSQEELSEAVSDAVVHWTPRVMLVLVPLFAAMVGVLVRRTRRNYPQHLYFALHVHAAWFLLLAIAAATRFIPAPAFRGVAYLVIALWLGIYFVLALRRAYGVTLAGGAWRAAVAGVAYMVVVTSAIVAIVLPIVVRGR